MDNMNPTHDGHASGNSAAGEAEQAVDNLKAALAGLEAGEGPVPFLEGHGLQSRRFSFAWRDETLAIDFDMPCARLLADAESRRDDDDEIATACRLAILLLAAHEGGMLLHEGEASLSVAYDDDGTRYAIFDANGETVDEGDDWSVLVSRLETTFSGDEAGGVSLIWP